MAPKVNHYHLASFKSSAMRTTLVAVAAGLVLGASPLWLTCLAHPELLAARSRATLLIHQDLSAGQMAVEFASHYAANLNPRYWFLQADEMSGASIPNVGLHLVALAPLWLAGLIRTLGGLRRSPWSRLLLAWLLLYPIPAAICSDWNPHPMRGVAGMILFPVLCAIGGEWLIRLFRGRSLSVRRGMVVAACLALLINVGHFAASYFLRFPTIAEPAYQTGLMSAFRYVAEHKDEADFVLVTNWANQPYIYALLQEPVTPKELENAPPLIADGPKGFHQVLKVGRYLFTPQDPENFPEAGRRFQRALQALPPDGRGLVIDIDRGVGRETDDRDVVFRAPPSPGDAAGADWPIYVVRRWPGGLFQAPGAAGMDGRKNEVPRGE